MEERLYGCCVGEGKGEKKKEGERAGEEGEVGERERL